MEEQISEIHGEGLTHGDSFIADDTNMDTLQQNELNGDKIYYSIGEVAEIFKVNTSHIRFWTNEFGLKVRTTRKGDRLYTREQIKELKVIYHLVKERGFTLAGAKAKLKEKHKIAGDSLDLKDSLIALRNKLQNIRNKI